MMVGHVLRKAVSVCCLLRAAAAVPERAGTPAAQQAPAAPAAAQAAPGERPAEHRTPTRLVPPTLAAPLRSQAAASPAALPALQLGSGLGSGLGSAKRAATESPRAGSLTPRRKRASLTALSREPARAAPASPAPADALADRLRASASPQAMPPLPPSETQAGALPTAAPLAERGEQGARSPGRAPCNGQAAALPSPAATPAQASAVQGAAAAQVRASEPGVASPRAPLEHAQRQSAGMARDPPQPAAQVPARPPPTQAVPLTSLPLSPGLARTALGPSPPRLLTAPRPMVVRVVGAAPMAPGAARVGVTGFGAGLAVTPPGAGPVAGPAEARPATGYVPGLAAAPPAVKLPAGPAEKPPAGGAPRPLKREVKALGPPLSGSKRLRAAADAPVWAPADGGPIMPGTRLVRTWPSSPPACGPLGHNVVTFIGMP